MQADQPASLYIVIPPSDIKRLRPLIRIPLNQFLTRLTAEMDFEGGRSVKHYKHRLLLMLDEFTSVGKLEIFEDSRSEEHTSELQSLMRISYAVFCLKK